MVLGRLIVLFTCPLVRSHIADSIKPADSIRSNIFLGASGAHENALGRLVSSLMQQSHEVATNSAGLASTTASRAHQTGKATFDRKSLLQVDTIASGNEVKDRRSEKPPPSDRVDDGEVEDGKSEDKEVDDGGIQDRKSEDPPVDDGVVEDRESEDKQVDDGVVEDKKNEDPPVDNGGVEDRKSEDPPVDDGVVEDRKSEDKEVDDGVVEDKNNEDLPVDDGGVEDRKSKDPLVDDGGVEDRKSEDPPPMMSVRPKRKKKDLDTTDSPPHGNEDKLAMAMAKDTTDSPQHDNEDKLAMVKPKDSNHKGDANSTSPDDTEDKLTGDPRKEGGQKKAESRIRKIQMLVPSPNDRSHVLIPNLFATATSDEERQKIIDKEKKKDEKEQAQSRQVAKLYEEHKDSNLDVNGWVMILKAAQLDWPEPQLNAYALALQREAVREGDGVPASGEELNDVLERVAGQVGAYGMASADNDLGTNDVKSSTP